MSDATPRHAHNEARPIAPCGCDAYRWIDCGWCYNPDCAALARVNAELDEACEMALESVAERGREYYAPTEGA